MHLGCGALFKNKVPVCKRVVTEDNVIRPGWRTRKRQPEPRLMRQSSEHKGRQSAMEQQRRQVLHILNPNANIARGKGVQGSGQFMSPLGVENQDTEQPHNAE